MLTHELRAGEREVGRRRARLPDVLADRRADDDVAEAEQQQVVARRRSSGSRRRRRSSAGSACGRPRGSRRRRGRSRRCRGRRRGGERRPGRRCPFVAAASSSTERRAARTNAGPQQQILGRVAGHRELGEEHEVGAGARAPRRAGRGSRSRLPSRSPTTLFIWASASLTRCPFRSEVFSSRSKTLACSAAASGERPPAPSRKQRIAMRRRSSARAVELPMPTSTAAAANRAIADPPQVHRREDRAAARRRA